MATHDYIISNASGAAVRADLNNALAAIATNNSSATEPTTTYAYQWWADTGSSPTVMKLRNAANSGWVTLFQLDGEWTVVPFENGTAAAPSIYFKDSGTDTGIYSPGTDQVAITTGGTGRLFVDASGNVGVGAAPGRTFQVTNATNAIISAKNGTIEGVLNATTTGVNVGSASNDFLTISTNGAERIRVTTGGSVGIGTTSPGALLDLGSATVTQGYIKLRSTGSGAREANIYSPAGGGLTIDTNSYAYPVVIQADTVQFGTGTSGTERARIDSSGRLLVGTSSARSNFYNTTVTAAAQIEGTTGDTASLAIIADRSGAPSRLILASSGGSTIGSNTVVANGNGAGSISFQASDGTEFVQLAEINADVDGTPGANDMPGRLVFSTTADGASSPTERMRIGQSGAINTFSPDTASFNVRNAGSGSGSTAFSVFGSATSTTDGSVVMIVRQNGDVRNNNGVYSTISDLKLKENVVDASSQWDDIKAIKIRNWNFKEETGYNTHRQIGPIAQELEIVCPGLVSESVDRDEEGNDLGTTTKGVNQSVLYMKAVKALQEAMERIETLEAKVAALESA